MVWWLTGVIDGRGGAPQNGRVHLQETAMPVSFHDACQLCGATEQDRPLVQMRFRGDTAQLCVICMPTVCRGLDVETLAEKMRERRSAELNAKPIARPGLRY